MKPYSSRFLDAFGPNILKLHSLKIQELKMFLDKSFRNWKIHMNLRNSEKFDGNYRSTFQKY